MQVVRPVAVSKLLGANVRSELLGFALLRVPIKKYNPIIYGMAGWYQPYEFIFPLKTSQHVRFSIYKHVYVYTEVHIYINIHIHTYNHIYICIHIFWSIISHYIRIIWLLMSCNIKCLLVSHNSYWKASWSPLYHHIFFHSFKSYHQSNPKYTVLLALPQGLPN